MTTFFKAQLFERKPKSVSFPPNNQHRFDLKFNYIFRYGRVISECFLDAFFVSHEIFFLSESGKRGWGRWYSIMHNGDFPPTRHNL